MMAGDSSSLKQKLHPGLVQNRKNIDQVTGIEA